MGAFTELFNSVKEIVFSNFVGIVIGFVLCSWLNKPKQATGGGGGMQGGAQGGMQQRPGMPMNGQGGMQQRPGMPMNGQGGFPPRQNQGPFR